MDPFLGQIIMFGGNFAPRGWALCDGQLLPISSYSALFSILGTIYGGDGRTTFALPELRGRVAMHAGNGPGLSSRQLGQKSGQETHTLTTLEMPSHNHVVAVNVANGTANSKVANDNPLANRAENNVYDDADDIGANKIKGVTCANAGNSQAHNNLQPYQVVNYIIALQGTFPSRN